VTKKGKKESWRKPFLTLFGKKGERSVKYIETIKGRGGKSGGGRGKKETHLLHILNLWRGGRRGGKEALQPYYLRGGEGKEKTGNQKKEKTEVCPIVIPSAGRGERGGEGNSSIF